MAGWGWDWWLNSDAGLAARISIGLSIFLALAAWDLARRGRAATRWREYLFLAAVVAAAMAYGAASDRIASDISWEYFYYGKGLDQRLGPRVPPDAAALHREACKIGLKATWSAGLIVGVVLLVANNPGRGRPQLPYTQLLLLLPVVLLATAVGAALGGWVGAHGWLAWTSRDLRMLARDDLFRPQRFMCVYGINLGSYAGGLLATAASVLWIIRRRRRGE